MNTNTKFPNSNLLPMHNKFGMHMAPVYRVLKPSEVPADKAVDQEGLEYSDVYPLEWSKYSFSHDASSNKTSSNTFILNDYIKKP